MWTNEKWTYRETSGEHSGEGTIFGVCPYGFGLRWDISGHWYRGFAQNFDTFHMGRVVWPGEPFLKKCPNIKKHPLFSKYACRWSQEHVPKISFFPKRTTGSYLGGSFSISRFTSYIRMAGFQYIQVPTILKWLTTYISYVFTLFSHVFHILGPNSNSSLLNTMDITRHTSRTTNQFQTYSLKNCFMSQAASQADRSSRL